MAEPARLSLAFRAILLVLCPRALGQAGWNLPVQPDYTSPPAADALAALPRPCDDSCVASLRESADANGTGSLVFVSQTTGSEAQDLVGIVFYPGAFVDSRAYASLASTVAAQGIPVVVPVFPSDVAQDCDGSRAVAAASRLPNVRSWVLAGHSLGGLAALQAFGALHEGDRVCVAGIALVASYSRLDLGCATPHPGGNLTAFADDVRVLQVTATEDLIVNSSNLEKGQAFLPASTDLVVVQGGNHGQFGSYDASGRVAALGPQQVDGNATIDTDAQIATTATALVRLVRDLGAHSCDPKSGVMMTSFADSRWLTATAAFFAAFAAACLC